MKPTIRTIAEDLGLSPATVSKALSGRPEVNEETRRRVSEYARERGYLPVKPGSSGSPRIGMLVVNPDKDIAADFSYSTMMGFQQYATKLGYEMIMLTINSGDQDDLDALARGNQLLGLYISGLKTTDPFYRQLGEISTPVVTLDIFADNPCVGGVGFNSVSGGRMAMDHLVSLGHRRIGFVNGHGKAYVSQERLTGYIAGLCHNGLSYDSSLVFDGGFTEEGGMRAADYFRDKGVTALYCASDLMAFGAVRRLHELGVNLPGELSVVGFDNLQICTGCMPPLTTVAQDRVKLGITACAVLHGLIRKVPINHVVLEPALVLRSSTVPPPGAL